MKIIPVIDLKNNLVVHAKQGDRENYLPINTPLCASADIYHVIDAFLSLYEFDTFYIADLNAITELGNHNTLIAEVMATFPELTFWVDKGYQCYQPITSPNYLPVLGSECYQEETVMELSDFNKEFILSLDYAMTGPLGAARLFTDTELWPNHIIIMTLACVGSNNGPDTGKLQQFLQLYPEKNFIAAGGIRNSSDLQALEKIGITQALIASALHSGAIQASDIAKLQAKKYPGKPRYF